jgi:hypothetical protein
VGLAPGASLDLELTRSEGAGFLTRFPIRCTDTLQDGTLKTYIKKHYDSWLEYARDPSQGFGEINPILVSGIDSARDWAMFTYSTSHNHVSTELTIDVPAVASTWASFSATSLSCSGMKTNWGPEIAELEAPSGTTSSIEESDIRAANSAYPSSEVSRYTMHHHHGNRITFIRGWRMKKRSYWIPTVIRAEAEPRDLERKDDSDSGMDDFVSDVPEVRPSFNNLARHSLFFRKRILSNPSLHTYLR